ncbi:hypothetical protein O3M35_000844 [Rhynocoris fuscipes]|uniref:Polynucleotide adenylyltransferase n=1 Tax=Rhynocoris fuscipes TaxID=488301 RepID=A0AAW1DN08_9HEMI
MFNNELSSGVGRGRGRGRGRLTFKSSSETKGGSWIRGDKILQQATSNAKSYKSVTSSSHASGHYRTHQEHGKIDDHRKVSSNSPPYVSNPSLNMSSLPSSGLTQYSSSTSTMKKELMPQLHRRNSPPPQQLGKGNLNQTRSPTANIPPLLSQQVLIDNFRQELQYVRSQINYNVQEGSRSKPNNSFNDPSNNGNAVTSPRRGNKRPVTSPSKSNGDNITVPKSSGFSGTQSKKYKKKQKSDTDSNGSKGESKPSSRVNPELYQLKISEDKSFTEQAEELISQLEQTDDDRKMRLEVLKDVTDIFSPYLPQLEPQIYGSTFTNIAFKTSDLDIFLYCPNGQPEYNFVLEKGRLMYKSPKFTNIVRVSRARVPVIKATHIDTNVDVDISTMSGQAVYNSRLIKHLLSVDNRLRPLAMLISLWVKLNTITGQSRFTSYSIILMLIYYLQKVTPPILPPLKDILYSKDKNDWPNFFINKPLQNENNSNLAVLFKGFFEFYVNFNYEKVVISPYLGTEIPTAHFNKDVNALSDEFKLYKNKLNSDMLPFMITYNIHVQDPIEHNVNTTKGVFLRLLRLFHRSCDRFLSTCSDNISENQWLPLIIKQTPLKLVDEKKNHILINYPVNDDENWFQNCIQDFKELLKIILINIKEDECELNIKSSSGKRKDTFFAEASYNVFNKKFRFPLRMYITGVIPLNELKNQFEMVINRVKADIVLFKAKFILEVRDNNGRVKVTIVDKNTTGLNSFATLVNEFQRYCGKFLSDIVSLRQSTSEGDKSLENKVTVTDLDTEGQERLSDSSESNRQSEEVIQVKDDSKTEESSN